MFKAVSNNGRGQMKVLHVAPLPPPMGGMVTYAKELLNSKLSEKTDARVVRMDYLQKENYAGPTRFIINFLNGAILLSVVIGSVLIWRPHIVHVQTNSGMGFFEKSFLILIARLFNCKTFLHVHGGRFREFYYESPVGMQRLIRWCGELPDIILVASPQMRETWRMIGVPDEKVVQINNAVRLPPQTVWDAPDISWKARDGISLPVTILFLTRIVYAKGIIELIDAANSLTEAFPMLQLRIVGAENAESLQIREYLKTLDMDDNATYVGFVTEEEKQNELLHADLYAFPTHVEDQSYAVMEAMSYGLPCIASAVGGVPSLIENGVNGVLIPPKNTEVLVQAIKTLIQHPDMRQNLGWAARRTVERAFTWDRSADEIYAIYQQVCSKPRQSLS
ncbi:MAG: glycosyltransferase family 4 protein [Chloroflexi bacterium]|nr:glycosyltransferase family 4 protein [Chloroflexota bacterium]